MVSRPLYHEDDEPSFRRYSSRGHEYPLSHGRESGYNPYQRPSHHASRELRDRSAEHEELPRTRSRIPVACARCRKRKIRCSGDNGTGASCTNCKSAGHEQCIFLRVSSTEAQLKTETTYDFDSSVAGAASRPSCRAGAFGPQSFAQGAPISLDQYPYRTSSLSDYQYGVKNFFPLPANYTDFGEESVEYNVPLPQYLPTDQMGLANFQAPGASRAWNQHMQKNLYMETPSPVYGHGQSPYSGNNFDMRPNLASDHKSINLASTGTPLPLPTNNGMDRILPFPPNLSAVGRSTQMNQYQPANDNMIPGAHGRSSYYEYGVQTLKSQNHQAVSDNGTIASSSSYPSMPANSPDSLNSPNSSFPTQSYSLPSSQPEVYTPPDSNDGLYTGYGPSNAEEAKRASHSSQGGHDGLPSLSDGTLANGHRYIPPPSYGQGMYPAPPISIQPQPRRQSGVLA